MELRSGKNRLFLTKPNLKQPGDPLVKITDSRIFANAKNSMHAYYF